MSRSRSRLGTKIERLGFDLDLMNSGKVSVSVSDLNVSFTSLVVMLLRWLPNMLKIGWKMLFLGMEYGTT